MLKDEYIILQSRFRENIPNALILKLEITYWKKSIIDRSTLRLS